MHELEEVAKLIEAGAVLTLPGVDFHISEYKSKYYTTALGAAVIGEKPEYIRNGYSFPNGGDTEFLESRSYSLLNGIYISIRGFSRDCSKFISDLHAELMPDYSVVCIFTYLPIQFGETGNLIDVINHISDACYFEIIDPRTLIVRLLKLLEENTHLLFQ